MKTKIKLIQLVGLVAVLGLAACVKQEDPFDTNPLGEQVNGLWWGLTDATGTLADNAGDYTRMGLAWQFNKDGTGYGVTFFFNDDDGDPIAVIGGEKPAALTYTTTQDGRITPDFSKADKEDGDYFAQFSVSYKDGMITVTAGTMTLALEHPSDQMAQTIRDWEQRLNFGAPMDVGFNPNDTDFNLATWREQEAIYLYDGTGEYSFTQRGRTCLFSLVPLPWYEGTKYTNLPDGFCDDITPENGWELVINLCGSTAGSLKNNNFFAVYNKYSGILRFFYYLPEGFSTGNDHVWEISISDHLARESVWTYGLPSDRDPIDKATIGQNKGGFYSDYVTPWVKSMSREGLIVPNVGWWAFDVDFSQPPADDINPDDIISLQMRSWTTMHATLASTVAASIDGTYDGDIDMTTFSATASSSKGVSENLSGYIAMGKTGYNAVSSAMKGDYFQALSSAITFGMSLYNICGAKEQEDEPGGSVTSGKISGSINLGLTGNIDTHGLISGSNPTVGIASPTIYVKDMDTKNTHFGQGVWNLRTVPVVYWTDRAYPWDSWEYSYFVYRYFCFTPYVFDPNSVEIELNPDVFPDDQIEWIEVNALCGARKERQPITGDSQIALRKAYGVSGPTTRAYLPDECATHTIIGQDDCLWDFFYDSDEKLGLNALNTIYTSEQRHQEIESSSYDSGASSYAWNDRIQGRGIDGYSIEPQVKGSYYKEYHSMNAYYYSYIPFLEVNVTVRVKMKNMDFPIVLSRNYLPQIKEYGNGYVFTRDRRDTRPYADKMEGHTELYDYQMKRIDNIIERYSLPKSISNDYYYIPYGGNGSGYSKLFDGNPYTKWSASEETFYYVEFYTHEPTSPKKYFLTTCEKTSENPRYLPKSWKLMAKASEDDEWTTIATVTDDSLLPAEDLKRVEYAIDDDTKGKQWRFYRFEISETTFGIELAGFELGE